MRSSSAPSCCCERGVEQVAHDRREGEPDRGGDEQAERADDERVGVRAEPRGGAAERRGATGGGRRASRPARPPRSASCVAVSQAAQPARTSQRSIERCRLRADVLESTRAARSALITRSSGPRRPVARVPLAHAHHATRVGRAEEQHVIASRPVAHDVHRELAGLPSRPARAHSPSAGETRSTTIAAKSSAR